MSDGVLVTGASGFIGRHLVPTLQREGYVVRTHSGQDGNIASCQLRYSGIAHVIHLAGRTYVPESWTAPHAFYETNVLGTVNVLDFCRRNGASLTLLSSYVYGTPESLPIAETHPVRAFNPYSHSKIVAEDVARYYERQFGIPITVIRPFNIYGPGQQGHFLIPLLIMQALDPATDEIVVNDLRPKRDYLYITDLVEMLCTTTKARRGDAVYNASSGQSVDIRTLVELINHSVPSVKSVRSRGDDRTQEVLDVIGDMTKARHELGWAPRVALSEGIRLTVQAMRC